MNKRPVLVPALLLLVLLALLFHRVLTPGGVVASNDAPLGMMVAATEDRWEHFWHGSWVWLNWLGNPAIGTMPNYSHGLYVLLGAIGYAKFYAPLAQWLVGLAAMFFCRRAGFNPWVGLLMAIAAMLNSNLFSHACWGLASRATVVASLLFALGVLLKPEAGLRRWLQAAVAGFAVGFGVMEGADVGAIFSLYAGAAVLFLSLNGATDRAQGLIQGALKLALVAACAAWIASYTVSSLVGTQIKGIAGTAQDEATRQARWDSATQWSWPKIESIRFLIPGVYGYRMDTPAGGAYWGTLGAPEGAPQARFSGGGEYAGVLVVCVALWAIGRSFARSSGQPFTPVERRWIWFWGVAAVISLLFSFGRFAPFYHLVYALPYFSTIRNPIKFLHPFHASLLILFAYGLQGIWRQYVEPATDGARKLTGAKTLGAWWTGAAGFDRTARNALGVLGGVSLVGALLYTLSRETLLKHLASVGFDQESAPGIAGFSIKEVWIYVVLLAATGVSLVAIFSGKFTGAGAAKAGWLLTALLALDLVRANTPWVTTYDYTLRYQTNPVVEHLREKPWEGRATAFAHPQRAFMLANNRMFSYLHNEWLEHHFQYNRIQSLDIIQMPRIPELDAAYLATLTPRGENAGAMSQLWAAMVQLPQLPTNQAAQVQSYFSFLRTNFGVALRLWQLTNTRWLLGSAGLAKTLNEVLDPVGKRFREVKRFDFAAKPGVEADPQWPLQQFTAVEAPAGGEAITEFTGALPRARLYTQWESIPDETAHRRRLLDPTWNPEQVVLTFDSVGVQPIAGGAPGEVNITSYRGNRVTLATKSAAPGILLLNDKWDPHFVVTVDGQPARLLRCNFLMRGVEVPAGAHEVVFRYTPSMRSLYVSLAAWVAALASLGFLARRGGNAS